MPKKSKYPSTDLTTSQRELVTHLVGPLDVCRINRSVFRDIISDTEFTVPKSSFDRCVATTVFMRTTFFRDWMRTD